MKVITILLLMCFLITGCIQQKNEKSLSSEYSISQSSQYRTQAITGSGVYGDTIGGGPTGGSSRSIIDYSEEINQK